MKKILMLSAVFLLGFATIASAAARVNGIVKDENGKPVEGAQIIFANPAAPQEAIPKIKTGRSGKWAALLPIGGSWNIDIVKEGYITDRGTIQISEVGRTPMLHSTLKPVPKPKEVPVVDTKIPQAQAAVDAGIEALKAKKWDEAAQQFQKAHELLPDNNQIKRRLAEAYHGEGKMKEAIAQLQEVHQAEPDNAEAAVRLTEFLLEDGQLDASKALLASLPPGAITDPTTYVNFAIVCRNKNQNDDALGYLDKAQELDPNNPQPYYYRGMFHMQMGNELIEAKKGKQAKPLFEEAKSDFQKLISIAPDSSEAGEAKQYIPNIEQQLKRMK